MRAARPFIAFYDWCANAILRAFGVEAKDELEITVSTVELSEMIAESLSEGLLDPEEHNRLTRALQIRNRVVADVARTARRVHAVPVAGTGSGPTVGAVEQALAETGYSRFPVADAGGPVHRLSAHQGRAAAGRRPETVVDLVDGAAAAAACPSRCRCPTRCRGCGAATAIWRWSPTADGGVIAMVALEDLVEDLVGTVRDGTHRV